MLHTLAETFKWTAGVSRVHVETNCIVRFQICWDLHFPGTQNSKFYALFCPSWFTHHQAITVFALDDLEYIEYLFN